MRIVDATVAIATCHRPAELRRCLEAVTETDVLPRELIVVEQGSEESSGVISQLELPESVRLAYFRRPRRGLSASRNAALERATCPIVAFTDDDCLPDHDWLARLDLAFSADGTLAAVAGRVLPLGPEEPGLYAVASRTSETPKVFTRTTCPWVVGTGANVAVRREWIDRIGGFDERLGSGSAGRGGEDIDLIYRLLAAGARIGFEPAAVVYHERQDRERWRSSRSGYGHGIGAFCSLHVRRGEARAALVLARWFGLRLHLLGDALWALDGEAVLAEVRVLRGTLSGFAYGLVTRSPALPSGV